MIAIPYERTVNPVTHTNFEATGVKPRSRVDETQAFQAAMRKSWRAIRRYAALKADVESKVPKMALSRPAC